MTTILKIMAIVLIGLYFSACGTQQVKEAPKEVQYKWDIDKSDKVAYEKFMTEHKQCEDFAFKAVIAGSFYQEFDIYNNCLFRKGYKAKVVSQGNP